MPPDPSLEYWASPLSTTCQEMRSFEIIWVIATHRRYDCGSIEYWIVALTCCGHNSAKLLLTPNMLQVLTTISRTIIIIEASIMRSDHVRTCLNGSLVLIRRRVNTVVKRVISWRLGHECRILIWTFIVIHRWVWNKHQRCQSRQNLHEWLSQWLDDWVSEWLSSKMCHVIKDVYRDPVHRG